MIKKINFLLLTILLSLVACSKTQVDDPIVKINNLQEYLELNASLETKEIFAFGVSVNTYGNPNKDFENNSTIHFYNNKPFYNHNPTLEVVSCYETESVNVDKNDFSQYKRKDLMYRNGGFFSYIDRPSDNSTEVWAIVTYKDNGVLYMSKPIKIQPKNKPLHFFNNPNGVSVNFSNKFLPEFSWEDGVYSDSETFSQEISDLTGTLLTSTVTNDKNLKYKNSSNLMYNFSKEVGWGTLKLNKEYAIYVYGTDKDNWATMHIRTLFTLP